MFGSRPVQPDTLSNPCELHNNIMIVQYELDQGKFLFELSYHLFNV